MDLFLAFLLLAAAFAILGYPILTARPRVRAAGSNPLGELTAQRDGLYATLRDLDQDYQLGKLDQADYSERRERYLARAALILRQIDGLRQPVEQSSQSDEIERQVAALRAARAEDESAASPTPPPVPRPRPSAGTCPNCGRPYRAGDLYCGKCGQALSST